MTNEQKLQIKNALVRYVADFTTQYDAAVSLINVSNASITLIVSDNWQLINKEQWCHIAEQVGFYDTRLVAADTTATLLLRLLMGDAKRNKLCYGIAASTGIGKTFIAKNYTRENDNILFVSCNPTQNRRTFMMQVCFMAGIDTSGTVPELIKKLSNYLSKKDDPLLIIDNAHVLKNRCLHLLVLLKAALTPFAGIVIMGNEDLRIKITEGINLKKIGFDELYEAIGKQFISIPALIYNDTELICNANNVYDEDIIKYINTKCNGNLHFAARLIEQAQLKYAA